MKIIRTGIAVAIIIGRDSGAGLSFDNEVDPQAAVIKNGVSDDCVVLRPGLNKETIRHVASDQVGFACPGTTYGIVFSRVNHDPILVGDGVSAVDIKPDDVSQDNGICR